MKDQLRKKMFKKRLVRKITFAIANGVSIQLNSYALIRPTLPGICIAIYPITCGFTTSHLLPISLGWELCFIAFLIIGAITWLDSVTNRRLKVILHYYSTYPCLIIVSDRLVTEVIQMRSWSVSVCVLCRLKDLSSVLILGHWCKNLLNVFNLTRGKHAVLLFMP